MNEEVIIDGVNVSGCIEQGETVEGITCGCGKRLRLANRIITKHKLCKDDFNCYYKRLKRCEQKLEKIKEIAETALKANYCNNCDGVGLPECGDYECHTYVLDKVMDIIEGAEDE